jgi:hypothetical protein
MTNLPWRLIGIIAALIAIIAIPALLVRSCDVHRSKAAQSRVERSQAAAASNSAADAIATQERSSAAAAASEDLTRSNEKDIRNAQGSNAAVDPAARDAGVRALCLRRAYRDDPRCRVQQPRPGQRAHQGRDRDPAPLRGARRRRGEEGHAPLPGDILMKRLLLALAALLGAAAGIASTDPVKDTRQIMAGTVTTSKVKNEYLSGARDGTAIFKGALNAYKAVRAAEAPVVIPPVVPPVSIGITGAAPIPDTFSIANWIEPAVAEGTSPDEVGAFRFTCLGGHLSKNDPLVYPGQKGASHLHQFFGNTGTDENSTYQSLRTKGGSTCTRSATESPQRSAYWMPAMLDGAGNAVRADWMNTYYKEIPNGDPACSAPPDATHLGKCIPIPNGIDFILGYNFATGKGGPTDLNSWDYWAMGFDCVKKDGSGESYTGFKHTMSDIVADGRCPVGAWLRIALTFPNCWDGKNLDTADHRAHVAYASGALILGQRACDAEHPYKIPEIAISAHFTTDANFAAGKWMLSSDMMLPAGSPPGKSLHMDYWEAWGPIKDIWQKNCINGHLSCSSGNLGDGTQVKGMQGAFPIAVQPKVPLTSIP